MQAETLIQMDTQGRVVLPRDLRGKGRKYFACHTEKDGTVHLVPVVGVITTKQAYFWTKRWQRGEKQASQALKKGRTHVLTPDKLKNYLDSL